MNGIISKEQFKSIQTIMEKSTGIHLAEHKRPMIENRLSVRLKATQCRNYEDYLQVLAADESTEELQYFIDRLTTHETRFFRESIQFEHLIDILEDWPLSFPVKVWSAACSTGEEVYSLAMVLEQTLGNAKWSLIGSDISSSAIEHAERCQYDLCLAEQIPSNLRRRFCLKGVGDFEGHFTVSQKLRRFCRFKTENLLVESQASNVHIIFLRNVLIYFSVEKQKQILENVIARLAVGGYLFLGHSENVLKRHPSMELVENCIYRKVSQ